MARSHQVPRVVWFAIGGMIVLGSIVILLAFTRRSSYDLGAVSSQWIVEHTIEIP
jgi:hypothetical protein